VAAPEDHAATSALLAATRALLAVVEPAQVAAVVVTLVHDLGGGLVPARLAREDVALQLDVSMGLSEPLLAWADPVSVAALRLTAFLPGFLEDARQVLAGLVADVRRDDEATRDVLTGTLTRRAWMRRLSQSTAGDSVCLIDLDHFKQVNDTHGHAAGDEVLRALGLLMARSFRADDFCGRYGGDELSCLSPQLDPTSLAARCENIRLAWRRQRPGAAVGVGLSVGVALVDERGGLAALRAADKAMYRAKVGGRDRIELACLADYDVEVS